MSFLKINSYFFNWFAQSILSSFHYLIRDWHKWKNKVQKSFNFYKIFRLHKINKISNSNASTATKTPTPNLHSTRVSALYEASSKVFDARLKISSFFNSATFFLQLTFTTYKSRVCSQYSCRHWLMQQIIQSDILQLKETYRYTYSAEYLFEWSVSHRWYVYLRLLRE